MTVDDLSTKLDAVLATALANAVDPAVIDGLGAKADAIQGALTATP